MCSVGWRGKAWLMRFRRKQKWTTPGSHLVGAWIPRDHSFFEGEVSWGELPYSQSPILCGPPYPSECPGSQQLQQYWDLILSRSAAVLMKADIVFWFLCDSETKPSIWVKGPMQSIPNARDSTPGTVANKCIQHPNLPLQREPTLSRGSDWSFTSTRYVEMQGFQTLRP